MLCEGCGYIVSGLPEDSRCPECGKAIAESLPGTRTPPLWEREGAGWWRRFWGTTWEVLVHPSRFYRAMPTRAGLAKSLWYANAQTSFCAMLFGLAMAVHFWWTWEVLRWAGIPWVALWLPASLVVDGTLNGVAWLAARLTAWEAAYRGLRLPLFAVKRGLHYHSAHYLPVALVAALTIVGYQYLLLLGVLTDLSAPYYLYVLCGEVVVGAVYLFKTYWIGMRKMMYANA